ncbi:hypothetical protein BKH46_03935 [Helicobacter sp. 12S02634-8]|uniref:hypothetical protein n=1 Tax=Helicobacter sp. 12S02634-8 TaxID=1476199 RepID=UPI000BA61229|nr:hypothetical protein [Helicobacter sp. 12S02634-8]PAF47583.1 hypothetical protein BKH46_03935 [Helicobacter sp. 12S02634-8]
MDKFKEIFYQDRDNPYLGKIIVFLPKNGQISIDKNFMDMKAHNVFVERAIKQDMLNTQMRLYR